jgi:hypothetical protein
MRYSTNGGSSWTSWSGSVPTISANTAGTYIIETKRDCNASGCNSNINSVNWVVVADPNVSISGAAEVCVGGTVTLTANVSGGAGTASYQWRRNGSNVGTNSATYTTANSLAAGNYSYDVIVTQSASACQTTSATVSANVVADPVVTISGTATVCEGGSVTLTANVSGGLGTPSYQWRRNGVNIGTNSATYITDNTLVAGNYSYDVIVAQSVSGCQTTASSVSANVVADPVAPTITKSPNVASLCEGATLTVTSSGGSGGTGTCNNHYRFTIDNGSTWSSWSNTIPSFAAVIGTNRIQSRRNCTGSGCNSNINNVSWTVVADPAIVTQPQSGSTCYNAYYTLSVSMSGGSGTYTYQWQESTSGCSGSWNNVGTNSATNTTNRLTATHYYRVLITNSGNDCNNVTSSCATVTIDQNLPTSTWTGDIDTDWYDPYNWSHCVPGDNTYAIIPGTAPRMPEISIVSPLYDGDAKCKKALLDNGGELLIQTGGKLKINE